MADKTINQLTQATALTDSSLFVIEQNATAKQANWGMMKNYISPGVAAQYSTSATYNVGDYCIYNGQLYRCITAITTGEAWTAAHWTAAVLGDDVGELKSQFEASVIDTNNLYDTSIFWSTDSAITNNGDGSFTVGTGDWGRAYFGGIAISLNPGVYSLYGVPNGQAYLSTNVQNTTTGLIASNENAYPKTIVIKEAVTAYLCFIITQPPSASFVIRPFLYGTKISENEASIADLKSAIGQFVIENKAKSLNYCNGYYKYYQSGEIRRHGDFSYSQNIPVVSGTYYVVSGISAGSHITFWDINNSYVSGMLTTGIDNILIPDNVAYMVVSIQITEQPDLSIVWRNPAIISNVAPIATSSGLSDLNDAKWNRIYVFNIVSQSDFSNISNIPVYKNGTLFTIDTDATHYAGRQIYLTQDGRIYQRYYIPATDSFTEWVNKEQSDATNNTGVLYSNKLTPAVTSDFVGEYTVIETGFQVGANLQLNKYFSIENRTASFLVDLKSDSSYGFGTRDSNGTINTLVTLDTLGHVVQLYGFASESVPFLVGGHTYTVDLSKKYQNLTIKVTDMYTGNAFEKTYVKNGSGGAGSGAVNPDNGVPMQYDYYFCKTLTGTQMVARQITVKCDTADVVLYGDSITEPEAYWPTADFPKSWTQLLIGSSCKKVVTSGRSGSTITELYNRIQNELPYLGAKYCVVTIGTNGGNTVENLSQLIKYIKGQDVIPILNHIPCYDNNGNTTGYKTVNTIIDTVRSNESIKGCNFDLATSLAYDGDAVNTEMMWKEEYNSGAVVYYHHPNIKGSAAMIEQLRLDVPEIF